jgi:hypothetical protein
MRSEATKLGGEEAGKLGGNEARMLGNNELPRGKPRIISE